MISFLRRLEGGDEENERDYLFAEQVFSFCQRGNFKRERDMDLFEKCDSDGGYFGPFRAQDDFFFSRPILDPIPGTTTIFEGKKCIQWSINNYLGLAENEEIKAFAVKMVEKYGLSAPMGSRMMTGNTKYHREFEQSLADYLEKEAAVVFNYGYLGVLGTMSSLVEKNDTIVIDKLSHASMVDGMFLSQGKFRAYKHNDMDSLESHLKRINRDRKGGILIVTEGVFGMRGDLADLPNICDLKEKYDARLFIDDAHGFGVMHETGKGTAAYFGVQDRIDVYFGTFAKAFAAIGGVSAADKKVIDWIKYNARTQVFAKSMPMVYVEVLKRTLEVIKNGADRREKMYENANMLKSGLLNLGYNVGRVPSPITAVYVPAGDLNIGMLIIKKLREQGIFITGVMYPVVPKGIILFRMIPTASHSKEEIQKTIEAFKSVRDELNLRLDTLQAAVL
ncbi:MAG: pyridoxal phosphate-dependent aminotransferase family protein [Candidatus Aminicenantes bacterium]|nr:pyridoxal phosphate-dependent aminotransferase family protein [Candidatus Aminicenantes bacterium]